MTAELVLAVVDAKKDDIEKNATAQDNDNSGEDIEITSREHRLTI